MFNNMLQFNNTLWHPTATFAGGEPAFERQAGERRRRASSLHLASPPVATRNGLACLPQKCAILTHKFCYKPKIWDYIANYLDPGFQCLKERAKI